MRMILLRVSRVLGLGLIALALLALPGLPASSSARAQGPDGGPPGPGNPVHRPETVRQHGPPLGIVQAIEAGKAAGPGHGPINNLSYHGGPVLQTGNHVHTIYWIPSGYSVSPNYQTIINKYFSDVAVAGKANSTTNVYSSDDQYYNFTTGQTINYAPTFGANDTYVDKAAFPASGCTDSYSGLPKGSPCLTDEQLQTEILADIANNGLGWMADTQNLYFIFTPKNVGSCAGNYCSYSYYCAYHSWAQLSPSNNYLLYANMPYAAGYDCNVSNQPKPNGDDADYTINVLSHEHNESITDPEGTAWYDRSGNEDGDKCAWNFGTATLDGKLANQLINGAFYYLQQEWSNKSSGCVLSGQ